MSLKPHVNEKTSVELRQILRYVQISPVEDWIVEILTSETRCSSLHFNSVAIRAKAKASKGMIMATLQ